PDVVEALALLLQELGHRRVLVDRRQKLHVGVGDLQQRLLHTVALHHLPVGDLHAVRVPVELDRSLEVVDGDGNVVDLGQHHASFLSVGLRNSVILSRCRSRSSGSVTPSPSSGASTSTPSLPSCRLWCTWLTASATCSNGNTAERTGWMRPSPIRRFASHASR